MQSRTALNEHERRVVAYHEAGPRAVRRAAAGRRPRPQGLDRARAAARSATRSTCPEEDRYLKTREELIDHDDAARRPRGRGDRLRRGHHGRRGRPLRGWRRSPARWCTSTRWARRSRREVSAHGGEVSDRTRELRDEEQQHLADEAMRSPRSCSPSTASCSTRWRGTLLRNEVLERDDIETLMADVTRPAPAASGHRLRVVAASDVTQDRTV
jgi:cell division protease FtsH